MNNAFILELSQRIGWTLVHSVWQFALIAFVLAIGLRLLRGCSSHVRYGFMLVALCAMPIVATVTFCVLDPAIVATVNEQHVGESLRDSQISRRDSQIVKEPKDVRLGATDLRAIGSPYDSRRSANNAEGPRTWEKMVSVLSSTTQRIVEPWMNTILTAWLFGMLVLSIRPLVSWRATRALRSHGRSLVPAPIACAIVRIAERLRIRQAIEVTQSTLVDVPTITDERLVKDSSRLLDATQLALQQVPFDSKDYAAIATQRARLLGQTKPDQPLPGEWLEELNQNPKLKYEFELAHANGSWEE